MNILKKIILCTACAASVSATMTVTGFADWKCNSTGWWYSEGSSWATGWRNIDNEWYLFDSSGYMLTGWAKTDNKWYYLNEFGAMAHDCKIGEYELGSDGAMIEKTAENQNTSNTVKETTAAQGTANTTEESGSASQDTTSENSTVNKSESSTNEDNTTSIINPDMVSAKFTSSEKQDIEYWLSTPKDAKNKKMPLIIYLHGYWGTDTNINSVIDNEGLPKYVYEKTLDVPAYVLCPLCPNGAGWDEYAVSVKELIADLVSKNNIDPDKISVTGHSMGGAGTWIIDALCPDTFSCIAPVSSFVNAEYITKDTFPISIPVYAIVGDKDTTIQPQFSIDAVNKINELGGNAKLKELKGADHIATSTLAYLDKDTDLINWMMSQTKKSK